MFLDIIDIEEFPELTEDFNQIIQEDVQDLQIEDHEIYEEEGIIERLDNDAITDAEEGFMQGFINA